jgi:hypothetical protein
MLVKLVELDGIGVGVDMGKFTEFPEIQRQDYTEVQ